MRRGLNPSKDLPSVNMEHDYIKKLLDKFDIDTCSILKYKSRIKMLSLFLESLMVPKLFLHPSAKRIDSNSRENMIRNPFSS